MATVGVAKAYRAGENVPVLRVPANTAESVTSSAVSAANGNAAVADEFWMITPLGNVWAKFGPTPVATAGGGPLLASGNTYYFEATLGDKVAFIDAS